MKVAYFDCPFGAGGDMLLAALLDCGIDTKLWLAELNKIALPNDSYKIALEQVQRCSLRAKKINILENEAHNGHHEHGNGHKHEHEEFHHNQRNLKDINALISNSKISSKAKELAQRIFFQLAQAEGFVHDIAPEEVHFHEVGAIDSIIDIIGFAIAYNMLGIERSIVSPLPLGSGTVQTQHGIFPVPGPATLQLIHNAKAPINDTVIDFECLTPTAAAILTTIANDWKSSPDIQFIDATGYGAGTKNPPNFPNICRVITGQKNDNDSKKEFIHSNRFSKETIGVIETILDDFSPQALSYVTEQLLKLGAIDTYVTAATAKKGRSGHLLTVLCLPNQLAKLEEYIFEHTSTLGLRVYSTDRLYLNRQWTDINLDNSSKKEKSQHKIRMKIAQDTQGEIIHVQPEYEDCVAYANTHKVPLKEVINLALQKFYSNKNNIT